MTPIYRIGHTLCTVVAELAFRLKIYGRENLIEDGPAIYASNHASYLDPPLVGVACRKEVFYLARKTLFEKPVLGPLLPRINCIPVDRDRGDVGAVRTLLRLLKEGKRVVVFPEGTRSKDGNLQPARAGLGLIIAKSLAPVVPVRVFGSYAALPRSGRIHFVPITLVVGKPIFFTKEDLGTDERLAYQTLSDRVMSAIAALEKP
ncbi:MAG TPA: lysophospholipid acyltransferase family protein [Chthoniobacterales bacterium]|nr:lysophospholipid acyltransferase family protein [Chthoniobacterales bacterium]